MRIISLHCDYIKFKALKKALKKAEDSISKDEIIVKEPLVILIAIEKGDNQEVITFLTNAIDKIAKDVKSQKIVLYPYAHLSSNLSSPDLALTILRNAEKSIIKKGYQVTRAPFGYYKSFELKVKGHPLSELSREFSPSDKSSNNKIIEEEYNSKILLKDLSRSRLDTSKLKENDHRILGQKLDLFSFNESSPGSVFWHNNGWIIYNELIKFARELLSKHKYKEISTPEVLDKKLWKISGHWEKYRDNIFLSKYENRDFAIKPMNCPGGMLVYKATAKSYRDLPLRVAEFGTVHRQELSGVLSGLFRVIKFTQDDAHIFCTEEQLEDEILKIMELVKEFYKPFGLESEIELSTRPEKRIGEDKIWDKAEEALKATLKKKKIKFKLNKGDGAFYGPKIDFHIKDSLKRNWQLGTIQVDFLMPTRFELYYTGEDNKHHQPIMLHRAIFGSLERFIGILLEHTNGNLPLWLSPIQVRIINFTDRNNKTAEKTVKELKKAIPTLRVDYDLENTTVGDKVRNAELMKIPYIIVLGDKEEESKTLAVRTRGSKPKFKVKLDTLIREISDKINKRI